MGRYSVTSTNNNNTMIVRVENIMMTVATIFIK
jgi:hypothetical protein